MSNGNRLRERNWIFLVKTPEGFAGSLWKRSSKIQEGEKMVYGIDLDTGEKYEIQRRR